jgi:hypothetical protein
MIIIYNLWALLVIAIIAIVDVALYAIAPGAFSQAYFSWTIGLSVTVIGAAAELLGARARFFFVVPIWFLGTLILGILACDRVGPIGLAIPVLAAAFVVWWTIRSRRKLQHQIWTRARSCSSALKAFAGDTASAEFWQLVKGSLYFPPYGGPTCDILSHNLDVTRLVFAKAHLPQADAIAWSAVQTYLENNVAKPKCDIVDRRLIVHLGQLIDRQIQSPTRPALPPPLPAAPKAA